MYCQELLGGLASSHPQESYWFCYRPHRYLRSFRQSIPSNAHRFLLHDKWRIPKRVDLFHGLNQRMPESRLRLGVCTFHDLFVLTGDYSTAEFRRRFAMLSRHAAECSDLVIAVSKFTADQVTDHLGIPSSRIRVVHHGVRPLPHRDVPREPLVLHVGAIQRRKNIARLIGAFQSLPAPWKLVLAGSAGFGAEEIESALAHNPARDRIQITGYVSRDDLATLYSRASIFAFPSLDEGFGMPILEAMSHGVPVLTSSRSALPEVAGDAALLVDPFETDEIAGGLIKLANDNVLRADLQAKGEQRAKEFTWTKAVEQTRAAYEEILG